MKILFVSVLLTSLCYASNTSYKTRYKIELCVVPLKEIVAEIARPFVGSLQHMFVRGDDKTGLNFEPESPLDIFNGKARIGRQNYDRASCKLIFSTKDFFEYERRWKEISDAYDKAAKKYNYNLGLKNCFHVTTEIIKRLGYEMPADLR